jgi:hypothetical protein
MAKKSKKSGKGGKKSGAKKVAWKALGLGAAAATVVAGGLAYAFRGHLFVNKDATDTSNQLPPTNPPPA